MVQLVDTVAVGTDGRGIAEPHTLGQAEYSTSNLRCDFQWGMRWPGGILVGVGEAG